MMPNDRPAFIHPCNHPRRGARAFRGVWLLALAAALTALIAAPAFCVSLMPGWPQTTGDKVSGSPALGDLDGDGLLEVVVGSNDGEVYAWHADGTAVTGWPQTTGGAVYGSPALGDLDGGGSLEVVVGSNDGKVYAWHADGTAVAGWPQATGGQVDGTPALADLDGDGDLEVLVGSYDTKVYAWHDDGSAVAGWPVSTGGWVRSSPALGDLDGGGLDVVAGSYDGNLYAWHADGTSVSGWPQSAAGAVYASPALGDLDGDGHLEVVAGSLGKKVYAWHANGTVVTGWPQEPGDEVYSSAALGDIDGDGALEVVVGSLDWNVYAWHGNGAAVAGWPKITGHWVTGSPALADMDGDGDREVVVGSRDRNVYVWNGDGTPVAGWPQSVGDFIWSSPAVADLDGDGDLEVAIGSDDHKVYAWSSDVPALNRRPWPMFRHDALHTGRYGGASSGVTELSSGYVTPTTGDCSTHFTFRVKFWQTGGVFPDRVLVAIWSRAGTRWQRMWEYDLSDTNTVDGKWYTCAQYLKGGDYAYRFAAEVAGQWTYWPLPAGSYHLGPKVSPVVLSSGYVSPTSGTHTTDFTWRIKYWNTNNLPPDEIWCAIWWGSRGQAFWYPMWAYDPSDTTYSDGKWYTAHMRWLDTGAHAFRFAARQGANWAYWPSPGGSYAPGPAVGP